MHRGDTMLAVHLTLHYELTGQTKLQLLAENESLTNLISVLKNI